jgi:hypothetical protein
MMRHQGSHRTVPHGSTPPLRCDKTSLRPAPRSAGERRRTRRTSSRPTEGKPETKAGSDGVWVPRRVHPTSHSLPSSISLRHQEHRIHSPLASSNPYTTCWVSTRVQHRFNPSLNHLFVTPPLDSYRRLHLRRFGQVARLPASDST